MGKSAANMEDLATARFLIAEIGGVDRAYSMLIKQHSHWTHRRVRAFWNCEAAGIRFHEMTELAAVATAAKELADARKAHAEFVAKTARLARALERQDADFHRHHLEAMGRLAR